MGDGATFGRRDNSVGGRSGELRKGKAGWGMLLLVLLLLLTPLLLLWAKVTEEEAAAVV